jgi:6,7-dimethyl-8-ribityllumazine synthase
MSGHGAPDPKPVDCSDLRVAVVAASWHTEVMNGLLDGARRALAAYGVHDATEVRVPGTFELPVVAGELARTHDAVVALDQRTAVGFGVLTCDDDLQARDRAGLEGSREDKGYEATAVALETARTLRENRDAHDD